MAYPHDALTERIDDLETRIAYQDETIEALNKTVIEQWARLDEALGRIKLLESRMREVQVSTIRDASEETPPPHY
jgi:SlyX protein